MKEINEALFPKSPITVSYINTQIRFVNQGCINEEDLYAIIPKEVIDMYYEQEKHIELLIQEQK